MTLKPPGSPEKVIGDVTVTCFKVGNRMLWDVHGKLVEAGLKDDDLMASIYEFYPHRDVKPVSPVEIPPEYERKGIGTAVMKQLLAELKSGGFAGVYTRTASGETQKFLKENFEFDEIEAFCYFKKL